MIRWLPTSETTICCCGCLYSGILFILGRSKHLVLFLLIHLLQPLPLLSQPLAHRLKHQLPFINSSLAALNHRAVTNAGDIKGFHFSQKKVRLSRKTIFIDIEKNMNVERVQTISYYRKEVIVLRSSGYKKRVQRRVFLKISIFPKENNTVVTVSCLFFCGSDLAPAKNKALSR